MLFDSEVSSKSEKSISLSNSLGRHFWVMVIFFDLYVSCVYLVALIGFLNIAYIFPGGFGTIERISSLNTLFCTFCDDGYCLFFSHNWNPYIYGILANLKGRFLCRSR